MAVAMPMLMLMPMPLQKLNYFITSQCIAHCAILHMKLAKKRYEDDSTPSVRIVNDKSQSKRKCNRGREHHIASTQ